MAVTTPGSKLLFESAVCGRCAGSGSYSYCSMHGSRCFGCGGTGWKLTKRGQAAQNFLNDLREVPAGSIVVGDLIRIEDFLANRAAFYRVTGIKATEMKYTSNGVEHVQHGVMFEATNAKLGDTSYGTGVDSKIRKGFTAEEKQAQIKAAMEFQATLTKTGKPSKR